MSVQSCNSVRGLFLKAIEIQSDEIRTEYLDAVCGGNDELRNKVRKLVDAHFLGSNSPVKAALNRTEGSTTDASLESVDSEAFEQIAGRDEKPAGSCHPEKRGSLTSPPATIDAYKLREKIGEGGMGEVFVAEQTKPVRRKVALKIIKAGMATKDVVARFEAERQALAMMDHPSIARVFDGGSTESGQPYFVMELVQGSPITEFCDQQKLPTRDRLKLFQQVCWAVQHAHQRGIIHRDLKPSNVLVAEIDARPLAKVIDFGVAKAVSHKLTEQTVYTQLSQMIGTPLYMSPEQAALGVVDVDTRSDVYSLGVILYELLTGNTPFDREQLKQVDFDEMRRVIREQEPQRPSAMLSTLKAEALSTLADRRAEDPRSLSHSLCGELDWITMKALEKDRDRRYQSASELAADVERYLAGDVVEASPPSNWYRMRKLAARHKLGLIASLAIVASMMIGTAAAISQAQQAWSAQRLATTKSDLALQKAYESEALANFILAGITRAASPENARTPPTLHQFLRQASSQVDETFGKQPELEAWVRNHIGEALLELGDYDLAEQNIGKALEIWRELNGREDPQALQAADRLAVNYGLQGKTAEAIELAQETLHIRQRVRGSKHLKTLYSMNTLGRAFLESQLYAEAEDIFLQLLDISSEIGSDEHFLWASNNLGIAYKAQGKLNLAEKHLKIAIESGSVLTGADHPSTLDSMHNLAELLAQRGNYSEAKSLFQDVLAARRRVLGEEHPDTLKVLSASANLHVRMGELTTARTQLESLLAMYRQRPGNPSATAGVLNSLSHVYRSEGMLEESLHAAEESFKIFDQQFGRRASNTLIALNSLASSNSKLERWDQAQHYYEEL